MSTYEDELNPTPAEYYMQECFELAKRALGRTSPNPAVGAIVLDKNAVPVGKGYHAKAGQEHAEVLALREAGNLASGGTLIVNFEPCCHTGKTPPCTDLIIKSQIQEVIFSNYDPNPLVSGNGEKTLLKNNIKVISRILSSSGEEVNKFFFKWIKTGMPWITLKQAQTLDGKVALRNNGSKWITDDNARREVHALRNIYDAVLVGASTVILDDPKLTVRDIEGGRNPQKIILDVELITKPTSKVYINSNSVILATKQGHDKTKLNEYYNVCENLTLIELPEEKNKRINLNKLFLELGKKEILSVFVEAGPNLAGNLLLSGLMDEYILFISPKVFGDPEAIHSVITGELTEIEKSFKFKLFDHKAIGNDLMLSLRPIS